ncbi:cytochrome P450 [Alicyclobacillus dauci]|uniref:Cytochrome P450 n=1 Tax=Alicyclobacillus dauci TaxID=1475485 RepID=A0ABY6Z4Z3_9BACL|nr:cytochrome P450 [Alicyclobacillus dauci]WAH37824.1 cytochrome P450 [Alicyclobacillus dauci]
MEANTLDMSLMMGQLQRDRYAVYEMLRTTAPVLAEPGQTPFRSFTTWHLTRYDDCLAVLRDNRFIHEARKHLDASQFGDPSPNHMSLAKSHRNWMLFRDPPDHTRLRSLVQRAFTPKMVASLRPRIEQTTSFLLDEMADNTDVDLVRTLAYPLPVVIIAELLGVPMQDREQFRDWSNALFQSLDLIANNETWDEASRAVEALRDYFRQIVQARSIQPQNDLISGMVRARDESESLSEDELLDNCVLMLVAGHETTVNLIGNAVFLMLTHPDQLALLKADATLVPNAIEEVLRLESPIQVTERFVREDVELAGVTMRKGDYVKPWIGSANRDPNKFPNPNRFDITREPGRHLSFGQGIHFCLGAPLARLEGTVALQMLFERFPDAELLGDDGYVWKPSVLTRSLERLMLKLHG